MKSLYLWPESPALSLLALWLASVVLLWAAREPMLQVLKGLGKGLEAGLRGLALWCQETAERLAQKSRTALLAAGELELQSRISRELLRIDACFSEKLGQYSTLHRRLDDLLLRLEADYESCGNSPPEVPGWAGAVEAVAAIPDSADPNVRKVLEGIRESMQDAERRALKSYREDTSRRHGILGKMRPDWKQVRSLGARMRDAVARAIQTTAKIDRYVDEYQGLVKDREAAAHSQTYSAIKPFLVSLLVIGVALGGAFINFQLIALPMAELVPAGARLGGVPVATVSALVIVLMEVALGIFLMDMLGITDLFPKLATLAPSRRRLILGLSLSGLFFLAGVESSLAVLREQIVAADAALKLSLAGAAGQVVAEPATSKVPVIGQAVLGFVLPWILALVAIPLEMLLESGRHVLASLAVLALLAVGSGVRVAAHAATSLASALPGVYDVYVAIPLRLERLAREAGAGAAGRRARPRAGSRGGSADPDVDDAEVA